MFFKKSRSSRLQMFFKISVQLYQKVYKKSIKNLFLKILQYSQETPASAGVSCEYCKIFKNRFFIEHLRWLLLEVDPNLKAY